MTASLLALAGALLTLLLYQLLAEQLDYATTVRRRQLDAWAGLSALICFAGVLYGGLTSRSSVELASAPALVVAPPPAAIPRQRHPDLQRSALPASAVVMPVEALAAGADAEPPSAAAPAPIQPVLVLDRAPDAPADTPSLAEPGAADHAALLAAPEPVALTATPRFEAVAPRPSPTLQRLVTRAPVLVTVPAPTVAVVPTVVSPVPSQPTPVPVPTEHCGDPESIHMSLRLEEAYLDREADPQVLRYRAYVRNDVAFPVVTSQMVVTAQDSRSGSDQFGSDRRPDLRIGAGHEVLVEGAIKLDKHPSPFGRSELCISFVSGSCGRQADFPTTRRCFGIRGF